jgi:thiosulfate/3-mercaptopyruvate sulfurtransferase
MAILPPILGPEELLDADLRNRCVLVDARTGPDAAARYEACHLAGAVHVDLEYDLARRTDDPAQGGRHPLPEPEEFGKVLGRLGIGPALRVIVYDDQGGALAAARFWWMVRAAGHDSVQVLDGGLQAAIAAGIPTESGEPRSPARSAVPFSFDRWRWPVADASEVERAVGDPSWLVIDVRDPVRYRGEAEPFDSVPGHIPGAVNVPYASHLGPDGRFLKPEQLAATFRRLLGDRDPGRVIVHCGSGVTACHTLLAMAHAGIEGPKLYVGSWSEWCRSGRPVARGTDPRGSVG